MYHRHSSVANNANSSYVRYTSTSIILEKKDYSQKSGCTFAREWRRKSSKMSQISVKYEHKQNHIAARSWFPTGSFLLQPEKTNHRLNKHKQVRLLFVPRHANFAKTLLVKLRRLHT